MSNKEDFFTKHCALLRENDSHTTGAFIPPTYRPDCSRRLGEALRGNTVVSDLFLTVDSMLAPNDTTLDTMALSALLHFVQTSPTLSTVAVDAWLVLPLSGRLIDQIVDALVVNPNITTLSLSCIAPPLQSALMLTRLLNTATFLAKLDFNDQYLHADAAGLRQVASALHSNHTLLELSIRLCSLSWVPSVAAPPRLRDEPMLTQLGYHSTLQSLVLERPVRTMPVTVSHFEAIAALIFYTHTLQNLTLQSYSFNQQGIRPILNAMQRNGTISHLGLRECDFNAEATSSLVDFMQLHCNRGQSSVLWDLSISTPHDVVPFANHNAGQVVATMLAGSRLHSLALVETRSVLPLVANTPSMVMAPFFTALSENERRIRLADMRLNYIGIDSCNAMMGFLSKSCALRQVSVTHMDPGANPSLVLAALRQNGSLQAVSIYKGFSREENDPTGYTPFFSPNEIERIQAYCTRNHAIPALLREQARITRLGYRTSPVLPHLFVATRPCVRMSPNFLLLGLLSLGVDSLQR